MFMDYEILSSLLHVGVCLVGASVIYSRISNDIRRGSGRIFRERESFLLRSDQSNSNLETKTG